MAERKTNIEFANLHVRVGENGLLDVFDEIVWPALSDQGKVRRYGNTTYLFKEVKGVLLDLNGEDELAIGGRFVQDTTLTREQVLDKRTGDLKTDPSTLESAPSAFFVILLSSHRLIYAPETTHPPKASSFASTLKNFLRQSRDSLIEHRYAKGATPDEEENIRQKVTKKELRKLYPKPEVSLVHLSSEDDLQSFISRFRKITQVEITLEETNHEWGVEDLYRRLREEKESYGSRKTKIQHTARTKDGITPDAARERLPKIVQGGTNRVSVSGEDAQGDALKGDNKDFRLRTPVDELGSTTRSKIKNSADALVDLVKSGFIELPQPSQSVREAVRRIADRYLNDE
jgi:hypothetical protein